MAGAVAERTWRDADPDAVEPALAALWRDVGRTARVARAVMSNLIILRGCDARNASEVFASADDADVDAVAARHPSRIIVITHEHGCALRRAPVAARVGITAYGPPQARYGVELVAVRSSCDESSLPSIVRRLVRGDLPTTVWCRDDLSRRPPLEAIVAEARQLVYDSRKWHDVAGGIRAVSRTIAASRIDIADVNWRRLAPVRRALRHAAQHLSVGDFTPAAVRISHAADDAALATLLRGWLAARFSWPRDPNRPLDLAAPGEALLTLTIGAPDLAARITLGPDAVTVEQHGCPTYVVAATHEPIADAVAAELRSVSADSALRDAVRAAASG